MLNLVTLHSFIADSESSIIILIDTWLSDGVEDHEVFPLRICFSVYRRDGTQKRGVGVLIIIKNSKPSFPVTITTNVELVCVCVYS